MKLYCVNNTPKRYPYSSPSFQPGKWYTGEKFVNYLNEYYWAVLDDDYRTWAMDIDCFITEKEYYTRNFNKSVDEILND